MSNRAYITRLLLGLIATLFIMGGVKSIPTNDVRGALAWWELKNERFDALEAAGPRIIFAGGSATLFGLSAERFSALTDQPSFNFGLHANFGQEVLVNAALAKARTGDLLVWSPELSGVSGAFPTIAIYGAPVEPSLSGLWRLLEHWFRTPPDLVSRWARPIPSNSVYHADAIGPLGDQRRNQGRVSDALCLQGEPAPIDWPLIDDIVARARDKGVSLVFRFPTIADIACNDWAEASADALSVGLTQRGVVVLNREAMRRPIDDFHDTHYHLNTTGAERATQALVDELTRLKMLAPAGR